MGHFNQPTNCLSSLGWGGKFFWNPQGCTANQHSYGLAGEHKVSGCDDLDVDFWIKLKDNMTQHDTTMMSAGVHPCQIHLFFGDHGSTPQQFTNFEHLSKTTKMKPDSPLSHFQLGETPVSQVTRANFIQAFICKAMAIRLRRSRVILHKIAIECYRML